MKVIINNEKGTNPVLQNAVIWALDKKVPITLKWNNTVFDVEVWNTFLKAMWHGFAEASKSSQDWALKKRYHVEVETDGGCLYQTEVWLDEKCRGMRYVSLH